MIQRLTVTHYGGTPLEKMAFYFSTNTARYRLTHYEVEDSRAVWLHGFREGDGGLRFYASVAADEVAPADLDSLGLRSALADLRRTK